MEIFLDIEFEEMKTRERTPMKGRAYPSETRSRAPGSWVSLLAPLLRMLCLLLTRRPRRVAGQTTGPVFWGRKPPFKYS